MKFRFSTIIAIMVTVVFSIFSSACTTHASTQEIGETGICWDGNVYFDTVDKCPPTPTPATASQVTAEVKDLSGTLSQSGCSTNPDSELMKQTSFTISGNRATVVLPDGTGTTIEFNQVYVLEKFCLVVQTGKDVAEIYPKQ